MTLYANIFGRWAHVREIIEYQVNDDGDTDVIANIGGMTCIVPLHEFEVRG